MDIKVGDKVTIKSHAGYSTAPDARVMAIAEGYAMVRYPRAMPCVYRLKELSKQQEAGHDNQ